MAAIALSEMAINETLAKGNYSTIEIAGINSPNNVTVSGKLEELRELEKQLSAKNIFFRLLDLDYAFHSCAMDPIQEFLQERLGVIKTAEANIDFVSTVTGDLANGKNLTAEYWWNNVRKPVRFASAIDVLIKRGSRIFVEIGPHTILQRYITECLDTDKTSGRVIGTLRRNDDSIARINDTVLKIHLLQQQPDLKIYFPQAGNFVPVPTYPCSMKIIHCQKRLKPMRLLSASACIRYLAGV